MRKFLLSILVSIIGLVSFGYCGTLTYNIPVINYISSSKFYNTSKFLVSKELTVSSNIQSSFTVCAYGLPSGYSYNAMYYTAPSSLSERVAISNNSCVEVYNGWVRTDEQIYVGIGFSSTVTLNGTFGDGNGYFTVTSSIIPDSGGCPTCEEQYTSEECQQEYSLMPISSCDSEFCIFNNLCPVDTGSSGSGDLQRSALFINGIQHVGGSIIDVTIPSEIQRNYIYTGENEETFKLDVEGLNGDPDYIEGIIDVNSYRPTSEDFTQTFVGGLTLVFPYIIITAIVLFIWRFIRKIFK